jgi:hypothetical protein
LPELRSRTLFYGTDRENTHRGALPPASAFGFEEQA